MIEIISQRTTTVTYDPSQDQSEHYGWSKYSDEQEPTQQDQDRWGVIMLLFTGILIIISMIIHF